jgi:hypothetical protein
MKGKRQDRRLSSARPTRTRRISTSSRDVTEPARFLNIDLDVRSRWSLAPLAAAWPWAQRPMCVDGRPNPRWLILIPRGNADTAEAAARLLIAHVTALPPPARRCWNRA